MELSLDAEHRSMDALEFVNKQRQEYDRLLDEAPDIPHATIHEFNKTFPDKENKPDVCNGLNVIEEVFRYRFRYQSQKCNHTMAEASPDKKAIIRTTQR